MVVTAISMDTGKILEVETLIKQSHGSKMSITGVICNTFGWYFRWYHNGLDPVNIENFFKMWVEDHLWNSAKICAKTLNAS